MANSGESVYEKNFFRKNKKKEVDYVVSIGKKLYLCSGFGFTKTDNFFERFPKKVSQNG